jgi:hypothetical protein
VAAAEVLPGTFALWNMIRDSKTYQIPSLQQRGRGAGIVRLDESLADLVRAGKTTLETAKAYAEDPDEMLRKLNEPEATPSPAPSPAPKPAPSPPANAARQPADLGRGLLSRAGALWRKKD